MACGKRPYFCVILMLGMLALFSHLVGFVTPGWLVMRVSVMEETRKTTMTMFEEIDSGMGLEPKVGEVNPDKPEEILRKRRSEEQVEIVEESVVEENHDFKEWITDTVVEINTFDLSTSYGLWYSTVCVHDSKKKQFGSNGEHIHKESSSEDDDDKKGHCRCRKISTKCALYNSFIYEDPLDYINPGPIPRRVLSTHNFGYASLLEQRLENCLTLAFLALGLLSAFGGFRKVNGCRCAGVACIIFMLLAAFIALVPIARLGHYSIQKDSQGIPVRVHFPYSVLACGVGAFFAVLTAMVAGCALAERSRLQKPGHWYKFNNELEFEKEKEQEKPRLVFITEPLPEKPGLNEDEALEEKADKEPVA